MEPGDLALLSGLIFIAAALYSSVGHAGASGYIAAMALFGLTPSVMKPTALALNIMVAAFGTYRWRQVGQVRGRLLAPLLVTSIPAAFIGGALQFPAHWYKTLVALVLLAAALKLMLQPREGSAPALLAADPATKPAAWPIPWIGGAITGALVGLLSGLTGTGGGIFLSPLLLFLGWAGPRQVSGITAPFILVNSIAGLAGNLTSLRALPSELPYLMISALTGALLGTQMGIAWISGVLLQRLLGVVLLIAAGKLLLV